MTSEGKAQCFPPWRHIRKEASITGFGVNDSYRTTVHTVVKPVFWGQWLLSAVSLHCYGTGFLSMLNFIGPVSRACAKVKDWGKVLLSPLFHSGNCKYVAHWMTCAVTQSQKIHPPLVTQCNRSCAVGFDACAVKFRELIVQRRSCYVKYLTHAQKKINNNCTIKKLNCQSEWIYKY